MWEMFEKVWMNGGRVGWGQEWNCWAIIGDPAETVSLSISDLWAHLSWVSVAVLSNFCSLCLDVEEQFWEVCSLGYWTESVLTVICSCSRRGFVFLACHAPAIDSLTQCLLWTYSFIPHSTAFLEESCFMGKEVRPWDHTHRFHWSYRMLCI